MSNLRFFSDFMNQRISLDRELDTIKRRAREYFQTCEKIRKQALLAPTDRLPRSLDQASEGMSAVRIIFGEHVGAALKETSDY